MTSPLTERQHLYIFRLMGETGVGALEMEVKTGWRTKRRIITAENVGSLSKVEASRLIDTLVKHREGELDELDDELELVE